MARQRSRNDTNDDKLGGVIDYLLGRNTLIGIASLMLLAISGFATWSGMNDFIVGVSQTSKVSKGPAGLSVSNEFLVIAIVVALTFLMWLSLRETFGRGRQWRERFITFPLYLFLALWSVGFGYGFWWSLIAGEEATRSSLSGLQQDARDAGGVIAARLDAVRVQIDSVASWSETQMAREEASGGSCGKSSGAGRGPLYNARVGVRDAIGSLRDNVTTSWIGPVQSNLNQLRQTASRLEGASVADRQERFENVATEIRSRSRDIAARSNEFGKTVSAEMNALAASVSIAPGEAGFSCYDPTLAQRLRLAAEQAGRPAVLKLRDAAFNEGPAGVANAVKGLWNNIGEGISNGVSFAFSGFQTWPATAEAREGITGRDLIALLATLGIDIGLFVLTALNPPSRIPNRIDSAASRQIREAIGMAARRVPGEDGANMEWIRQHFINHDLPRTGWGFGRGRTNASWFVIPNLYAADPEDKAESKRALALNHLAGVLGDLGLIRWANAREFKALKAEETSDSATDLTRIRADRAKSLNLKDDDLKKYTDAQPIRNHGLFSKAERMLQIAKWSKDAQRDIEIFKLTDTEGLTPLLAALNDRNDFEMPDTVEDTPG